MRFWIWAFCLLAAAVEATDAKELFQKAMVYYEAGDYQEALSAWKTLLKMDLSREELVHASYNAGCTSLAAGRWQAALETFASIDQGKDPSPELERRLKGNMAWAEWMAAGEEPEGNYKEACARFLTHLRSSWSYYTEALEAQERVRVAEGGESEEPPEELLRLRKAIKERAVVGVAKLKQYCLEQMTLPELLSLVEKSIESSLGRLDTLAGLDLEEEKSVTALRQMSFAFRDLNGSWRRARSFAEEEQEEDARWLLEAESLCCKAADYLHEGDLWKGRQAALQSLQMLKLARWRADGRDPLECCLQERLLSRERAAERKGTRMARAAMEEEGRWTGLAQQSCRALLDQYGDIVSEEAELTRALHHRLDRRDDLSPRRAGEDLALRLATFHEPSALVQALRQRVKEARGKPEQWGEAIVALEEKFAARQRIEPQQSYERVLQLLKLAQGERRPDQLIALLDEVLKACDKVAFARARLEDARDHCRAALQGGVDATTLLALSGEQEALRPLLSEGDEALSHTTRACRNTATSCAEIAEGRQTCARALLSDSAQNLDRARRALDGERPISATAILEETIQEQVHAQSISSTLEEAEKREIVGRAVAQMACGTEEQVLSAAGGFEEALMQAQADPRVLELFQEGLQEAQTAKEQLTLSHPEWRFVTLRQLSAERLWKEALQKLQHPDDQQSKDDQQEGSEGTGQQEEGDEQESGQGQTAPTQVFEWLQQMDEEDGAMEQRRAPPKRGLRPW